MLLAEDNLVNQKLAVKILEKYGHAVEIAENGSLAVDAFKARVAQGKPFDIILVRFVLFSVGETNSLLICIFCHHRWMYQCHSWVEWKQQN